MTKPLSLTIVVDNCKGVDREEYAGDRRQREETEAESFLRRGLVECGSGTGRPKRFRESGSKRPRLIPVSGSEAVRVALLSDK